MQQELLQGRRVLSHPNFVSCWHWTSSWCAHSFYNKNNPWLGAGT